MNMKMFKTLKKMRWTQFFDNFEYFGNLLIINMLYLFSAFTPPNATFFLLTFQSLFRHFFQITDYTLVNT